MRRGRKKVSHLRRSRFLFPLFIRGCHLPCINTADSASDLQCDSLVQSDSLLHHAELQDGMAAAASVPKTHDNGRSSNSVPFCEDTGASGAAEGHSASTVASANVPRFSFRNRFRTGLSPQYRCWQDMFGQHRSDIAPSREANSSSDSMAGSELVRTNPSPADENMTNSSLPSPSNDLDDTPQITDTALNSLRRPSVNQNRNATRSLWIMNLPLVSSSNHSPENMQAPQPLISEDTVITNTLESHCDTSSSNHSAYSIDPLDFHCDPFTFDFGVNSEAESNWILTPREGDLDHNLGPLVLENSTLNTESTTDPQDMNSSTNSQSSPEHCPAGTNPLAHLFQPLNDGETDTLNSSSSFSSNISQTVAAINESSREINSRQTQNAIDNCSSQNPSNIHQNWYFYDPRLAPSSRVNRFSQHTNYNGIENVMSLPDIIQPPAYDEIGHTACQDVPWQQEPPPPYPGSELEPPPPYSSGASSLRRSESCDTNGSEQLSGANPLQAVTNQLFLSSTQNLNRSHDVSNESTETRSSNNNIQSDDRIEHGEQGPGVHGRGLLGGRPAVRWNVSTGVNHWASQVSGWLVS